MTDEPATADEPERRAGPPAAAKPVATSAQPDDGDSPPETRPDAAEPACGSPPATALARARAFVRATSPRQRIIAGTAALVLVAAATTVIVWSLRPLGPDVAIDADKTVPLVDSLPGQVKLEDLTESDSQAAEIPEVDDEPEWTYNSTDDERSGLRGVDDGYVAVGDGHLTGLDTHGKRTWDKKTDGEIDIGETAVTVSTEIDGDDSWPGRDKTSVLDATTGRELWNDSTASFVSVWYDTVYLSRCQGGQDGELGECVVSARDPRTGATRWTRSTYASTDVVGASATGSFVVFKSHVTSGEDIRYTVVDIATGEVLPGGFDQDGYGGGDIMLVDDLVIAVGGDDNPADDCRLPVSATSVRTGVKVWERKLGADIAAGGDYCGDLPDRHGDYVMAYNADREPIAVDLRTGKTRWTAPGEGDPVLSNGEYTLVRLPDDELAMYDTEADKKVWGLPDGPSVDRMMFGDDHVYFDTEDFFVEDQCWLRVDLDSGDAASYPGSCAGAGTDWLATANDDGDLDFYALG